MTVELLVAIAAAVLSLLFSYLPRVKGWYEGKDPDAKRQIMAGWLFIVTAALFAMSCVPLLAAILARYDIFIMCDAQSGLDLIILYLKAIGINQAVFLISPKFKK